jgi:ABC-2 type transport system ATP-binding protein
VIEVDHLAKRYGSQRAVDDLSFVVRPGKVTGFLGPNGAGKTTTLRAATDLIRADKGRVTFDGQAYRELLQPMRHVGVALEPTAFHPGRTASDHLMMLAPYAGVDHRRCATVLGLVGLEEAAGKRVGGFSLGMRGRLSLAAALLGNPEFLLLDEPVNGLDPEGIRWMRQLLRELADEGRTVLISSHLLSEVEQTVDEVVIIAQGRLVFQGSLAALEASTAAWVSVESSEPEAVREVARRRGWSLPPDGAHHGRTVWIGGATSTEVAVAIVQAGIPLEGLSSSSSDLESIFLSMTAGQGGIR